MALGTYAELQAALADWLSETGLTSQIPDFIALTEAEADREVRDVKMIVRATASLDDEYETLPTDFLEMSSIELLTSPPRPVTFLTDQALIEKHSTRYAAGAPINFTVIGEELRLSPPPDSAYPAELHYFGQIPRLSDSNTTNWLLLKHPAIYLWGSLLKAAPFLRDDDRVTTWASLYSTELTSIQDAYRRATHNAGPLRARSGVGQGDTARFRR